MAGAFVLDASVTLGFCFEDEASGYAEGVLALLREGVARVPPIWEMEVANVLVQAERRGRLTPAETVRFLDLLGALPIEVQKDPEGRVLREVRALARDRGLSVYDACYLDLAMREALPIATVDAALARAAKESGVVVLAPATSSTADEKRRS
jgi:predicted nucleic acid-binding protein